jgi:hypothetical protein
MKGSKEAFHVLVLGAVGLSIFCKQCLELSSRLAITKDEGADFGDQTIISFGRIHLAESLLLKGDYIICNQLDGAGACQILLDYLGYNDWLFVANLCAAAAIF